MPRYFCRKSTSAFLVLLLISLFNSSYIYAVTLQEEAEVYRAKGYEAQERGAIDEAITWYTKSASLDPDYAAPHNDLGILYEAKGLLDRAESSYQRALAIDPYYEKAHTNMALLYERKGELEKAAFHWMRRYNLGNPGDTWTEEARKRLEKIGLIEETAPQPKRETRDASMPEKKLSRRQMREEAAKVKKSRRTKKEPAMASEEKKAQAEKKARKPKDKTAKEKKATKTKKSIWTKLGFGSKKDKGTTQLSKVERDKDIEAKLQESLRLAEERLRKERKTEPTGNTAKNTVSSDTDNMKKTSEKKVSASGARHYYQEAQGYYKKGEYSRGLDVIRTAKKEHPDDPGLLELEESIKTKMKEERIEDHYKEGIMLYRQEKYPGARKEFEAILNILPE